ncbi:hypothetical protein [Natrarchaeobius halalkaliphilus]|uniref:hypothetical protein n=1 Tax=Natrarchaeobius halalkaliphilus TaxID=1679091 RepID=UPI0014050B0F|nr:hypothetical protein [Natrarchaeobius halalkaliphilus]
MENTITVIRLLMSGVVIFGLITIASLLGATLALRWYHEDEQPSMSAAVNILRGLI